MEISNRIRWALPLCMINFPSPQIGTPEPTPWPAWAKTIALLSRAGDLGVGDTVARVIGPHTSQTFQTWHLALFQRPCGCARRRAEWNAQFPYPKPT